ncbi:hypothetical protein F511_29445 [Dorcoceras hygrometricum]|uniref:Uncharacterized protein n=1 Tax=Dorcoceras hygrometricum TaxID=472368 RepID=A0A2Z7C1K0_9LAMI|nr:hypothetical protein F511_29445 [Dorcoceras hygrometricum]
MRNDSVWISRSDSVWISWNDSVLVGLFIPEDGYSELQPADSKFFQAFFQSKHLDNDDEDSAGYQSYFRRMLKTAYLHQSLLVIPSEEEEGETVGGRGRVRLISKGIETAPAVRHAPTRTHGPNSPTLTYIIAPADGDQQVQEYCGSNSNDDMLSADERMSLDDILLTIPVDIPLPSSSMEITKIMMGKSIKIPGVNKWTWFLKNLPRIPTGDKGKEVLVEKDPVKGNPAEEHYSLICADIELLVNLRAQMATVNFNQQVHYMNQQSRCISKITKRRHLNKLTRHRFDA